jgi:hypothetical protein
MTLQLLIPCPAHNIFGWDDLSPRPRHLIHMATVMRRITSIAGFEAEPCRT